MATKSDFGSGDRAGIDGRDVLEAELLEHGGYWEGRGAGAIKMTTCICIAVKMISHKPSYLIRTIVS